MAKDSKSASHEQALPGWIKKVSVWAMVGGIIIIASAWGYHRWVNPTPAKPPTIPPSLTTKICLGQHKEIVLPPSGTRAVEFIINPGEPRGRYRYDNGANCVEISSPSNLFVAYADCGETWPMPVIARTTAIVFRNLNPTDTVTLEIDLSPANEVMADQ